MNSFSNSSALLEPFESGTYDPPTNNIPDAEPTIRARRDSSIYAMPEVMAAIDPETTESNETPELPIHFCPDHTINTLISDFANEIFKAIYDDTKSCPEARNLIANGLPDNPPKQILEVKGEETIYSVRCQTLALIRTLKIIEKSQQNLSRVDTKTRIEKTLEALNNQEPTEISTSEKVQSFFGLYRDMLIDLLEPYITN